MQKKLLLSSISKRIFARVFDILIFLFLSTIFFLLLRQFIFKNVVLQILIGNFIYFVVFIFYFVVFPYFFSYQTLAKKIFGISIFFYSPNKPKRKFFFLFFREFFIIFTPVFLTWILFLFYFLIMNILSFKFNDFYFLGRASIIIFIWWIFYFIFIRINPKNQIFVDRWFFVFVVDNRINFFIAKETTKVNVNSKKQFNNFSKMKINNSAFAGSFVSLNKEQREATVHSKNENLRILAGPGTGKTTVLTERITFLIKEHNLIPKRILTLTFTKKACENIKNKIIKKLSFQKDISLSVFTYHAFCYFFLRMEKTALGIDNIIILDRREQLQLIKSLLQKHTKEQRVDSELAKNMISIIQYLQQHWPKNYNHFISLSKESVLFEKLKTTQKEDIWNFWSKYNEYKQKEGFLDFNDLLIKTYQIFKSNPLILSKWSKKYDYLAIDEFQDTNKLQFKIIQLLTSGGQNIKLTVVGDPDQTIYGWRDADMNFILNFEKYFCDLKTNTLVINYRSTKKIINLANFLIAKNKERFPKKLITNNKSGNNSVLFYGENIFKQAAFVVNKINELLKKKISLNEIVILYRVNSASGILEKFLLKRNISYKIFKGLEFFKRKEVKELLTLLSILNDAKNIYIKNILTWINGVGPKTILRIEELANNNQQTIFNYLTENSPNFLFRHQEKISTIWDIFHNIKANLDDLQSLRIVTRKLFEDIYQPILENNIDYEIRLKNINVLIDEIIVDFEINNLNLSMHEKITQFLVQTHLSISNDLSKEEVEHSVSLMTIHSAKGLEFPYVFIFDVTNTNFPKISRFEINLEEERRLFFVAITRTQKQLFITTNEDYKSIFIEEIEESKDIIFKR